MIKALTGIAIVLWALTVFFLWPSSPPFHDLGEDSVVPAVVAPGGIVTVTRNIRVLKNTPMRVTRAMIKGDCRKSCEIIDLPTSYLTLNPGDYLNLRREHVVPTLAAAGTWRLVFAIHWDDFTGRSTSAPLKELDIEVRK